ncbi:hypothetical protein PM022_18040 [Halorubrum ezzemoulense]|nr:hypothetical protein [Halorubrum ezzemoulense]
MTAPSATRRWGMEATTTARQRYCGGGETTETVGATAMSTKTKQRERRDGGVGAAGDTIQKHRSGEQLSTAVQQGTAISRGRGRREGKR